MKGKISILLLALTASALWTAAQAQSWHTNSRKPSSHDDYHFGYVSGSVGYSMLQTNLTGAVSQGALGGAIGIGYEFRTSGFWTNIGVQMSFHRSSLTMDEYTVDFDGRDTQDHATVFHYRVNQRDEMQWNYLDVPLLAGYYVKGFYIGAGIKVSHALSPTTFTKATYNLSATNTELGVTFTDMPDRGYTDYAFEQRQENRLNIGVSLIGEAGYDLLSSMPTRDRMCHMLKIGFYFEYGLNNQLRSRETPQLNIEPNPDNATQATVHPYLNTFDTPARTVPFYTGVKLTYVIGGSRTARGGFHHGCMCYN